MRLFPLEFFRRRPRLTRRLGHVATFTVAFGLGLGIGGWTLVCQGTRCPSIELLERYQPRQTSRLYAADNRFVAEIGLERRTLITLDQIPQVVQDAFVITEDKRFYRHDGIDWLRVPGAVIHNLQVGRFEEGFSTITMQLARNIFPDQITRDKSPVRKLKEMSVARRIERRYPKEKILELYLNQINLGSGAYGVETAAQRYFGKSVRYVNLAEAATLAALPKAPGRYNPRWYPHRAVQRRNTIVELMRRQEATTDVAASLAKAYPLQLARRIESGEIAPYFVEWVRKQLHERFGDKVYDQGLKVYTTLDLDMQTAAERALENQLRAVEGGRFGNFRHLTYEQYMARGVRGANAEMESPYLQGAFVAIDPRDGAVRALVGGRDYSDSKFNRATQALRQPGSTFKPIVYSAAIQAGRSPAWMIDDAPISLPQLDGSIWTPENYDLTFEGPMTMRRGLYQSRNLIAIRAGMELGEQTVVDLARQFGLTTPIPPYPSIHIGSAEVYPIELIGAYTVFANLGLHTQPNGIVRVEDQEGNVLWQPEPVPMPVLAAPEAWLMVSMLKDVVLRGTANARVWNAGFRVPSGGKTGTTNDGADVWYVGFTADLVGGVWMGFDKPRKIMVDAQGGRLAAPAFTSFMTEVYRRKPEPPDWPRPLAIASRQVDEVTGLLAAPACAERAYTEYFLPGTEPLQTCSALDFMLIPTRDTTSLGEATRAALRAAARAAAAKAARDTSNPFRIPPR
ncbi:MAG TPA: PBP1A family penicillin-binding protein [Gemmatimonadaceae bacterium]|nr:PBP1A family penicillin-binding protein [Gemmatimonadaceae bacterium]